MRNGKFVWMLVTLMVISVSPCFVSCSTHDSVTEHSNVSAIADKVWAFSQTHPDGFTLDIRTMAEPTEGIAVSYAATQNSHSRNQLNKVISHALLHDGYVGGWHNDKDGLYYFDSTRLFPEDSLKAAIQFGKDNGQHSVFILSTHTVIPVNDKAAEILERDTTYIPPSSPIR